MKVLEQLYEGKAKKVFKTDDDSLYLIRYKDDATAFNGAKKGSITDKGIMNNAITTLLFEALGQAGIAHHLVQKLNEREQLVQCSADCSAGSNCSQYSCRFFCKTIWDRRRHLLKETYSGVLL